MHSLPPFFVVANNSSPSTHELALRHTPADSGHSCAPTTTARISRTGFWDYVPWHFAAEYVSAMYDNLIINMATRNMSMWADSELYLQVRRKKSIRV